MKLCAGPLPPPTLCQNKTQGNNWLTKVGDSTNNPDSRPKSGEQVRQLIVCVRPELEAVAQREDRLDCERFTVEVFLKSRQLQHRRRLFAQLFISFAELVAQIIQRIAVNTRKVEAFGAKKMNLRQQLRRIKRPPIYDIDGSNLQERLTHNSKPNVGQILWQCQLRRGC